jgi:hypothetical protein
LLRQACLDCCQAAAGGCLVRLGISKRLLSHLHAVTHVQNCRCLPMLLHSQQPELHTHQHASLEALAHTLHHGHMQSVVAAACTSTPLPQALMVPSGDNTGKALGWLASQSYILHTKTYCTDIHTNTCIRQAACLCLQLQFCKLVPPSDQLKLPSQRLILLELPLQELCCYADRDTATHEITCRGFSFS